MEALMLGAKKMHITAARARAGVVGATGSIGRACALLLSRQVQDITLFGNPRHAVSSRNRLNSLARDIFKEALSGLSQGLRTGMSAWMEMAMDQLGQLKTDLAADYLKQIKSEPPELDLMDKIAAYLELECPIRISLDLDAVLPACNLVVAASNSPEYILFPDHFQAGAVVCDVARPADVSPEVGLKRDDVLILEGGLVQYPDQVNFGPNFGYRDGVGLGCLSETILLALEGEGKDYSIGTKLPLQDIEHLRRLGQKHGFSLAGLRTQNRELTDIEIETVYQNSLRRTNNRQAGTGLA
jgi:predicted amino acid dehydrogenase